MISLKKLRINSWRKKERKQKHTNSLVASSIIFQQENYHRSNPNIPRIGGILETKDIATISQIHRLKKKKTLKAKSNKHSSYG